MLFSHVSIFQCLFKGTPMNKSAISPSDNSVLQHKAKKFEKHSSWSSQELKTMQHWESSLRFREVKIMRGEELFSRPTELEATEEKDPSSRSQEIQAMEENDFSLSSQELKAMKEKDSSLRSQEQYAMEEKEPFLSCEVLDAIAAECLGFDSPGRKRVKAIGIPNSSSSAASSATTPNDSTKTSSTSTSPAFSSNAQSVPLSTEDGGESSFKAATTFRNGSGPSTTIVGTASSTTPSVPHLHNSWTAAIFSILTATYPLVQDDLDFQDSTVDFQDATAESQEQQFPNTGETSDPKILLQEPNQQKIQKDNNRAQLPNCAVNAEDDPKDLPLMRVTRVLRGIPHCPHFIHLRGFSDLAITKMVAAWDQIFEAVVDEIQNLDVEDFWVRAFQLWETIHELHELGYNVLSTRIRFLEMVDLMEELNKSKLEVLSWKNKAKEDRLETIKCEMEVFDLKAWIDDEEDSMMSVREKIKTLENELLRYDDWVAQIAMKPFSWPHS